MHSNRRDDDLDPDIAGVLVNLEEQADEILMADRRKQGNTLQQHDWLTKDNMRTRSSHELLVDPSILGEYPRYTGQFSRAHNPNLGTRPNPKNLYQQGMDNWNQALWEAVDSPGYFAGKWTRRLAP